MSKESVPARIRMRAVLDAAPEAFAVSELAASAGVSNELFESFIDNDPEWFRNGDQVNQRDAFFCGRKFLITPEEWEIEAGILVPGHRFVPFVNLEAVFPSEVALRWGRRKIRSTEQVLKMAQIIGALPLLGSEQMFDVLMAESPENGFLRSGVRGDSDIHITVFDLADFYKEYDFEEGDALLCEVVDSRAGAIKISFLSGSERSASAKKAFISSLEKACEKVLKKFEEDIDIPEILAWSFFVGGEELNSPAASLDEFIRESLRIILASNEDGKSELRCADEEEDSEQTVLPEGISISSGETSTFADMLKSLGVAVTPVEIDGFILDACATREMDFPTVFSRTFRGNVLDFKDAAQEAIFMNAIEDRFEELTGNYNRVDDELKAPLRSTIMEALEERLEFLSELGSLDDSSRQLDAEKMKPLALVSGRLEGMLKILNRDDFMPDSIEIERLEKQLDSLLDEQDAAIETLRSEFFKER